MSSSIIHLDWTPASQGAWRNAYQLAHLVLVTDGNLDLAPANSAERIPSPAGIAPIAGDDAGKSTRIYGGLGIFAGREWRVACDEVESGYYVEVDGRSRFFVSADGARISRVKSFNRNFDQELLFGPVMTLALALRGMFMLHSSAVEIDGVGICFLGGSGAGKSTTAEYFDRTVPGAVRVVDDLAPFFLEEDLWFARGFPQAKLAGCTRSPRGKPVLPARILVWLDLYDPDQEAGFEQLAPAELTRRLVGSTMGTRMFNRSLLHHQLRFCADAAPLVRGFQSNLPKDHRSLETLAGRIQQALDWPADGIARDNTGKAACGNEGSETG